MLGSPLRELMDQLAREGQADQGAWSPAVDIYETPREVVIVVELAGVDPEEVQVELAGDLVRIRGHRQPSCCSGGARFHRMEIASGAFMRSIRVGVPYISQGVRAQFEDGLLYVTLPKAGRGGLGCR